MSKAAKLSRPYRVESGKKFRLKDYDPGDTGGLKLEKDHAAELLDRGVELLASLQDRLYAQDKRALLLIFQAMDAAGKDGTIKHVLSGVNPQGCQVYSFKAPSAEELDHDFLWRSTKCLPERGRIGIFNRSYYEEVLVVRVHPQILAGQKLPPEVMSKHVWQERYEDIASFERYLSRNGVAVVKFFLNVSKKEQKKRFLERLEMDEKHWKFSLADAKERGFWEKYMEAYEDMIQHTATPWAPWVVVPADDKPLARLIVAAAVHLRPEHHVLLHRQPGKQGVALKHHAPVHTGAVHGPAAHPDLARSGRPNLLKARHQVQGGGFAAPRGPQDGDELASPGQIRDGEAQVLQPHQLRQGLRHLVHHPHRPGLSVLEVVDDLDLVLERGPPRLEHLDLLDEDLEPIALGPHLDLGPLQLVPLALERVPDPAGDGHRDEEDHEQEHVPPTDPRSRPFRLLAFGDRSRRCLGNQVDLDHRINLPPFAPPNRPPPPWPA